jgi:hypothetical protein
MESADEALSAFRAADSSVHSPEQIRLHDARFCDRLFALPLDDVDAVWRQIASEGTATAVRVEPHVVLAVLHARMRGIASGDLCRAHSVLADYATVVTAADTHVPACIPERWVAVGREATRIAVGAPAPRKTSDEPVSADQTRRSSSPSTTTPAAAPHARANHMSYVAALSVLPISAQEYPTADYTTSTPLSSEPSTSQVHAVRASRQTVATDSDEAARPAGDIPPGNSELRSSHSATAILGQSTTDLAISLLFALKWACDALAPTRYHLVPLHADYLALCIQAKFYNLAIAFAREMRGAIRVKSTGIDAADILCVHYYLAVSHIAIREYSTALQHCRLAMAVPSHSISDIAVAVYKKFVIVSLLVHGSIPAIVKISSYSSGRMRLYASEYTDLAKPFETGAVDELRKLVSSYQHIFIRDSNLGLVKKLVEAMPRRTIIRLTSSYVTLSVEDVMTRVRFSSRDETEALLLKMIEDGSIRATIDARASIVRFAEESVDDGDSAPSSAALDNHVDLALKCAQKIRDFHYSILSDPVYAARKHVEWDQHHNGPAGSGMGMEDEDPDFE